GVTQVVDENLSSRFFLGLDGTILSVIFDIVLLCFALWGFVRHVLEAKAMDGGWSINVLVKTLVADHLMYFICNLTWLSLNLVAGYVSYNGTISAVSEQLLYGAVYVSSTLAIKYGPHMVINLRITEKKTSGDESALAGELSTIRFGTRGPPTQSESIVEGGGFRELRNE
ncbi:hypothetical protein BJ138DRAFT_1168771, partial [Hygrophoropsis aurantiaca]